MNFAFKGDLINVSYDINNRRNFAIKMKATLVEKHIFKANHHQKNNTEKHIASEAPYLEANMQSTGVIQVPIPANTRPSTKCSLIEVNYFVHILIDDKSSGLEFNFPVIVMHTNDCLNEWYVCLNLIHYESIFKT